MLNMLLTFKDFHVIFMNLKSEHLGDKYYYLFELSIDNFDPTHGEFSVYFVSLDILQILNCLLICFISHKKFKFFC